MQAVEKAISLSLFRPDQGRLDRMSAPLTKKQQKAFAFRAKQKAKKSGQAEDEQEDVPEQDLEEDEVVDVVVAAESSKAKRKRGSEIAEESSPNLRTRSKPKAKTAWDEDDGGEAGEGGKKSKKEVKQRFILFIGRSLTNSFARWSRELMVNQAI